MTHSNLPGRPFVVRGDGEVAPAMAAQWREALLEALGRGQAASVDLAGAEEIGLPVFQLLLSAERTFRARGVAFELRDPKGLCAALGVRAGIDGSGVA